MKTMLLPSTLPGDLDLYDINTRLRQGDIALDWSGVREASQDQLAILLDGLDMVEQSEQLGLDTVPESLTKAVLQVFTKQGRARREPRTEQQAVPAPAVWTPEAPAAPDPVQDQPEAAREASTKPAAKQVQPVLQAPSPSAIRDELQRLVLLDLLGPAGGPEEELDDSSVRDRYLVGMLAPRDRQMQPEELDELAIPEESSAEDGPNDDAALQIDSLSPSSIGMSFNVEGTAASLLVSARWGYYRREKSETIKTPKGGAKTVWKRQQMDGEPRLVPLREGAIETWSPEPREQPDVVVRGLVGRRATFWSVTLFLVNEQREPQHNRDEAWVFQPELTAASADGQPVFCHRATPQRQGTSDEELAMAMLYRRHVSFAIGHGIGTHAETLPGDPTKATRLSPSTCSSYHFPSCSTSRGCSQQHSCSSTAKSPKRSNVNIRTSTCWRIESRIS